MSRWLYENSADNSARFVLGEIPEHPVWEDGSGDRPLFCIGVNPSTATPEKLDPTLRAVKRWAKRLGFDGWIMLNLYPLRATDPDGLPDAGDINLHAENLAKIKTTIGNFKSPTIWAAWGNLITKRNYLAGCLDLIMKAPETRDARWIHIGPTNASGHPHHPLYLPKTAHVRNFEIGKYMAMKRLTHQRTQYE